MTDMFVYISNIASGVYEAHYLHSCSMLWVLLTRWSAEATDIAAGKASY